MNAAPIRAAIYARVSTVGQVDGTSLDEQRAICRAAILAKGWEVAGEYVDEGLSGTSRERPEWSRLLSDCRTGTVQAVVVSKLDRFARKAADAITETDRFSDLGVTLVVVKEQIDMSTPAGRMMRTMLAGIAEMERDMIVERTNGGKRAKALNGDWPGGKPSFGWSLEGRGRTAHPVPDERERQIIHTVHQWLVKERLTTGQVADRLNDMGLHPRYAKRWEYPTVKQTFTNTTLHTGIYIYGKPDGRSPHKRSHHTRVNRDGSPKYGPPIDIPMGNPPLTRQEFQAIQRALARRSPKSSPVPAKTQMLSGRVTGECGEHYNGVTLSAKDHDVYRCSGRRHRGAGFDGKCSCSQVHAAKLDDRVWAEVAKLLSDPARLEAMARQWLEVPEEADPSLNTAVAAGIDKQIEKLSRATERVRSDMYLADDPDALREQLKAFETELADLKDKRAGYAALQADAHAKAERLTDLVKLAERAKGRLGDMSPDKRREVIEILDIRVHMGEIQKSEPATLQITGQIDPRLFGDPHEHTTAGGSWCHWCS